MSTTFKIIENHIENSKTSPKKSFIVTSSQHLSPSSKALESDDGSESIDKEQVLKMEIKQLQRQNKFLKKKINELTHQLNGEHHQTKKKIVSGKGAPKQQMDPIHLTVDFFFKEVNNLMNSIADLFRVQFTNEEVKQFSTKFPTTEENINAQRRYVIFKKFVLTKKLQKVTLQNQQKRYPMLLDIFTSYYKAKQDCDKYIRQTVDQMSARALQLNKMILGNATKKKNSLKGSCIKSAYAFDDNNSMDKLGVEYQLNLPWTLKRVNPPSTLGILNDNIQKRSESQSKAEHKIE